MLTDKIGKFFHIGCKVVRAIGVGDLQICTVTDIKNNRLYLDHSMHPILYHERLLIIEHDPLFKILTDNQTSND